MTTEEMHGEVMNVRLGYSRPHLCHQPVRVVTGIITGSVDERGVSRLLSQLDGYWDNVLT